MTYNGAKLIVSGVLSLALIIAIAIDTDNAVWAVPILGLLVGYVVGNAEVTSREGNVAPILARPKVVPPPPEFP